MGHVHAQKMVVQPRRKVAKRYLEVAGELLPH
jgi:hypothetical protein